MRQEISFDLFAQFKNTTYHSSTWTTQREALARLESIRHSGINRAMIWAETTIFDGDLCHLATSELVYSEGNEWLKAE